MFRLIKPIYAGALVDAVKSFQRRHGRDPNGRIDTQTLADLNVPLSRRVRQMQLTLERWRWLPDSYQKAPIVVNIPEFRLRAYDKDFNVGVTMNVVVGKAYGHDTPVFSDTMQYVVFRPYWEVPYSITKDEMIPHIVRDPDYLAKNGFDVVDSGQNVVSAGTVTNQLLGATPRRETFRPAKARSKELPRTREICLSKQLQRIHARHSGPRILREVQAGFQPRLYPAGEARRSGRMGPARQSRLDPGTYSQRP